MHISTTVATLSLLAPLASAHSTEYSIPVPRVFGGRTLARRVAIPELKARAQQPAQPLVKKLSNLFARQSSDPDTCGPGVGSCAADKCCSPAGYCGNGEAYCAAPDCQINYGPSCDANLASPGTNTSTVPRPQLGSVPYGGAGIYHCTVPGTVAITYDDGPYIYTETILDLFDQYNGKATFFITGNNLGKGPIDNPQYPWYNIIQRMDASGHQIAGHTWSHQDLSAITADQRAAQIYTLESAFRNILGKFPTYMRPPYSSCDSDCQDFLGTAGYHITYFDEDTSDYIYNTPETNVVSQGYITGNLSTGGDPTVNDWLTIGHDIQNTTANILTEFMLKAYTAKGFKLVTVGECLGDPVSNWYRTAGGAGTYPNTTTSSATATASQALPSVVGVSTDASCGSQNGMTCLGTSFGNCCSTSGWCGSTAQYCGIGCQVGYGTCGSNNISATAIISTSSIASMTASIPLPSISGVSTDASCGSQNGMTCLGTTWGNCCSAAGWCGSTDVYCGTGCQVGYGNCGSNLAASNATASMSLSPVLPSASGVSATTSSTSALPSVSGVSTDATCGSKNGMTCLGTSWGNCCSASGWCGATDVYCGTGCQAGYGNCGSNGTPTSGNNTSSASSSVSSAASPVGSLALTSNGNCGPEAGTTCLGYSEGECCSQYGWCGNTIGHCGASCQVGFGKCASDFAAASSVASSSAASGPSVSSSTQGAASAPAASSAQASSSAAASSPAPTSSSIKAASPSPAAAKASSSAAIKVSSVAVPKPSSSAAAKKSSSVVASSSNKASSSVAASSSIKASPSPSPVRSSSVVASSSKIASPSASASPTPSVSQDRTCGNVVNQTCTGSVFGTCCIQFSSVTVGYCYSGSVCTLMSSFCQSKYGKC